MKMISSKDIANHPHQSLSPKDYIKTHKKSNIHNASHFVRIAKELGGMIFKGIDRNNYVKTIQTDTNLLGSNRSIIRIFGIVQRKKVNMPFEVLILQDGKEYLFWNRNHRKDAVKVLKLLNYHHE